MPVGSSQIKSEACQFIRISHLPRLAVGKGDGGGAVRMGMDVGDIRVVHMLVVIVIIISALKVK